MEFSKQEYWSGQPFPSPGIFLTHRSNLGFPYYLQIPYGLSHQGSCVCVQLLSHAWLFAIPWAADHQAPLSMGFSRQRYWSSLPFPSLGDVPNSLIKPGSLALQADSLLTTMSYQGGQHSKYVKGIRANHTLRCLYNTEIHKSEKKMMNKNF